VSLRERVAELANLPRQQVVLLNTLEERLTALENGTVDWSIGSAWVLWVSAWGWDGVRQVGSGCQVKRGWMLTVVRGWVASAFRS
jgi:hypothetical protein